MSTSWFPPPPISAPARKSSVPGMVDGNKDDLHLRRATDSATQSQPEAPRLGTPSAIFVGWGRRGFLFDFMECPDLPHLSTLSRVDPEGSGDRRGGLRRRRQAPDLCLVGRGQACLIGKTAARALRRSRPSRAHQRACRAGRVGPTTMAMAKPDLLLATPNRT